MTTPYAGAESYPTTVELLVDGDAPTEANMRPGHEGTLDRTAWLKTHEALKVYRFANGGTFPLTTDTVSLTAGPDSVVDYTAAFVLTASTLVRVLLQMPATATAGQCAVYIRFFRSVGGSLTVDVPHYAVALEDKLTTLVVEGYATLAAGTWDVSVLAQGDGSASGLEVPQDLDTTGGPIIVEVYKAGG